MASEVGAGFQGFDPKLIEFLRDLGNTYTREWFQAHYDEYLRYLVEPAREFVLAMGECLPQLRADIHAPPRVRGPIFAINLSAEFEQPVPPQVFDATLSRLCFEHFQRLQPLPQWFVDLLPD